MMKQTKKGVYFKDRKSLMNTVSDALDAKVGVEDFKTIGIAMDSAVRSIKTLDAVASTTSSVLTPSSLTPIQFLQYWVPGFVEVLVEKMKAADLFGVEVGGDITTHEIIRGAIEYQGQAELRQAKTNTFRTADILSNFNARSVQILQEGLNIDNIDLAIAASGNVEMISELQKAVAISHAKAHNHIAFYGIDDASDVTGKKTYGILTDPNLLPYVSVATNAAGSTKWEDKTAEEIYEDIVSMVKGLFLQTGGHFDQFRGNCKLILATNVYPLLSKRTTNPYKSVKEMLDETYPYLEVDFAPEFNDANQGSNVAYLVATDPSLHAGHIYSPIILQGNGMVPTAMGSQEIYYSSTAGFLCERPTSIYRVSGL